MVMARRRLSLRGVLGSPETPFHGGNTGSNPVGDAKFGSARYRATPQFQAFTCCRNCTIRHRFASVTRTVSGQSRESVRQRVAASLWKLLALRDGARRL